MIRLKIMTILTANPYFWFLGILLLAMVLMMVLIAYILKIIHETCED